MAYTDLASLTDRFGETMLVNLTDRAEPPAGAIDTNVIDQALSETDALIDGYVSVRYALPFDTVPSLVETLAQTIAIYKLHIYEAPPKIEADYKAAIKSLEAIASGGIRLPVAGIEAEQTGSSGARVTDRERPMTETNLKGFI